MVINNSIIHRLEKHRNEQSILSTRNSVSEISEALEKLLREIRKVYRERTGKAYGAFQNDLVSYPFSLLLKNHLEGTSDFVNFTKDSMNLFKSKIDPANLATGGYVLFIHYSINEVNYLMIVMLNDKSGITINDETLDILDTTHLDLEHLHLAARLDIEAWDSGDSEKYISFVKGRKSGESVSVYFREFLGCTDYTDSKEQSQTLLKVIDNYCDEKDFDSTHTLNLKSKVFDYCENKRKDKEPIYLEDLSHIINEEEPNEFLEYANSEEFSLSTGFEPHRDTIKRLRRIFGKDKKLTLSFDTDLLGNRIIYDQNEESLLIRELPNDLKIQLDEMS